MRRKLVQHFAAGVAAAAVSLALWNPLATTPDSARAVALQTLAAVGGALLTIQVAALAFFLGGASSDRLVAVLARVPGLVQSTLTAAAAGSAAVAFGGSVLIVLRGDVADALAAGVTGIALSVLVGTVRLLWDVLGAVERDAAERSDVHINRPG